LFLRTLIFKIRFSGDTNFRIIKKIQIRKTTQIRIFSLQLMYVVGNKVFKNVQNNAVE
jgi:hypothetical protein